MKAKIILYLLIAFGINLSYSQFTADKPDLRLCGTSPNYYLDYYNCTSNNYTLDNVFLSLTNVNGVPLDTTTCTPGTPQMMYIMLNYTSNSNSNIYHTRMLADLIIDGIPTSINVNLGTVAPGSGQRLLYGPFTWICGQEIILDSILIVWKTSGNDTELTPYNCNTYNKSQCEFPGSVVVAAPLAVQFTYTGCTNGNLATVYFDSTTNGGIPPYSFAWDFDSDGIIDSTQENPTHIYSTGGSFSATLTVTDSNGTMNTYIVPIVYPLELNVTANVQGLTCIPGSTASIDLIVTGGTPPYTYNWNTGDTTEDISNLGTGTYQVTVTDVIGCTKTYSTVISPIVCCEFLVTCPTFPNSSLQCYDLLPIEGEISEADFEALGNGDGIIGDNPCGVIVITAENGPYAGCNTNIIRTYTVTEYQDDNNNGIHELNETTILNSVTCNQNILINDTTPPTIDVAANDMTVECDGNGNVDAYNNWLISHAGAIATDNCDDNVSWSWVVLNTESTCPGEIKYFVRFNATDDCFNTTGTDATFTIQDTTAPTLITQAVNQTVECDGNGNVADLNAWLAANGGASSSDDCSSVTWSNDFSALSDDCGATGSVTVTFTATDDCGNSTSASATFTIIDSTNPVFISNLPVDISVSCDDLPEPEELEAIDNCSSHVSVTVDDEIITDENACAGEYLILRTWTATDDCGNSISHIQTINVYDNTPPTLDTPIDSEISVSCSEVPEVPVLEFSDNCSGIFNIEFNETNTTISIYEYTIVWEWIVSDNCGNEATFTQTINVSVPEPFDAIPYSICTGDQPIDLFTILGESIPTNGEWVEITNSGGLQGNIFNPSGVINGYYTIQYIVTLENDDCPTKFEVYLNVNDDCIVLAACDITVYNAVSANNDGMNDIFFIDGIECYPDNTVEIYNRWGILVYETRGYDNALHSFKGYSEGRTTFNKNEMLPDGTYFYILKYEDTEGKSHDKSGYLYLDK